MAKLADKPLTKKEAAIGVAASIYHYKWIAHSIGVSEDTLKRMRDDDPEFADRLNQERARFIDKNMRKARPEFLLESADREIFGARAKIELDTTNPIRMMVEKFGLDKIEGGDDGKDDGDVQVSSPEDAQ